MLMYDIWKSFSRLLDTTFMACAAEDRKQMQSQKEQINAPTWVIQNAKTITTTPSEPTARHFRAKLRRKGKEKHDIRILTIQTQIQRTSQQMYTNLQKKIQTLDKITTNLVHSRNGRWIVEVTTDASAGALASTVLQLDIHRLYQIHRRRQITHHVTILCDPTVEDQEIEERLCAYGKVIAIRRGRHELNLSVADGRILITIESTQPIHTIPRIKRFSDGIYYDLYYTGKTYPCRMCVTRQHKTADCTETLCLNLSCQNDYRRHSIKKPTLWCKDPEESEEGSMKVDNATSTLPDTKKYTATPPTTTIAVTSIFAAKLRIIAHLMDDKLEFNIQDTNI